jgi:hypothetical protein
MGVMRGRMLAVPMAAPESMLTRGQVEGMIATALLDKQEALVPVPTPTTGAVHEAMAMTPAGMMLDSDDHLYRRLTGGGSNRSLRRELNPVTQQRALEISWYLWEHNPLAKRLITFMTDLILGEGVMVEAVDERIQEVVNAVWNHRINQLSTRVREFHNSLSLSGELILPFAVNPITGIPTIGFIDSAQVRDILPKDDNVLIPEFVWLKPTVPGEEGRKLRVVNENPVTGILEGEVFLLAVNKLPNSLRGRPDLLPLADWLDLYDTYLFAEVERLQLLSAFVWDLQVEGADEKELKEALKRLPSNPKAGTVYAHNEKEKLDARTPELQAADRSEAGRMLRLHIAGTYGFPLTWLGESDSNNATMQGQNDVMVKTPTARQREFRGFLDQIVRFSIQSAKGKNRVLFQDAADSFKIVMPELSAKDISRVGQVLSAVTTAMDTAIANKTGSRALGTRVLLASLKHLGVEENPSDIEAEIQQDQDEADEKAAEMQATMARASALERPNPDDPADGPGFDDPGGE